jgi:GTP-binding protein YchF
MSGKTTIFNALTGQQRPTSVAAPGKLDVQLAVVDVPDPRLDQLEGIFNPERKVEAKITYADIGGLAKGISEGGLSGPFRTQLSQMDAFLHVVRVFDDPSVPHPEETVDPQRDLEILDGEFLLSDLVTTENRITRLKEEMDRGKDRAANARELGIFEKIQQTLEAETPLRDVAFGDSELQALRGYGFLTLKPKLVLLNTGESLKDSASVIDAGDQPVMAIQGRLEAEISQLDPDEAELFLEEYGIDEPVRGRAIRESYNLLSVQIFYTVGEDEVRAWSTPIGSTAQQAAGVIHSDLERGFIRAEIVPVDTLIELGGLAEVRQAGKLRLEGKDYIMQAGDVMTVRFNV